jgi:hypothetical protein
MVKFFFSYNCAHGINDGIIVPFETVYVSEGINKQNMENLKKTSTRIIYDIFRNIH